MTNKGNEDADYLLQEVIPNVYTKFQNPRCSGLTSNFIGEKEKWTNKGNDKQEDADSVLHNTTSHTQCLYQISKSLVQ